jgi:hypothetical protein
MITAFGVATEAEPGVVTIADDSVCGVHLTLLRNDGLGKADVKPNKIMIARSIGKPIVLAPTNDQLGLIICEGIETGLSLAEATGCGVWAAGSATRMRALADSVPAHIDTVTVAGEDDIAGHRGAQQLVAGLRLRGLHVEARFLNDRRERLAS